MLTALSTKGTVEVMGTDARQPYTMVTYCIAFWLHPR